MTEQKLREQIAQNIEEWADDFIDGSVQQMVVMLCASIARKQTRVK